MSECKLCVTIPTELSCFIKSSAAKKIDDVFFSKTKSNFLNFGVKLLKTKDGKVKCAFCYSDTGDLIKKIFYEGSSIKSIEYYRNNHLYSKEEFDEDLVTQKCFYNLNKDVTSKIQYKYNKQKKVVSISKELYSKKYTVEYGYDELQRINKRIIKVDDELINEQRYRFDILDRIIEYSDYNQKIRVQQISPNNELIYYTITDNMKNEISIINKFDSSGYKSTDITVNGHSLTLYNACYVDNIMLKKPYTTEYDIDLIISELLKKPAEICTKREQKNDTANDIIANSIEARTVPISIRKRLLYNMCVN